MLGGDLGKFFVMYADVNIFFTAFRNAVESVYISI